MTPKTVDVIEREMAFGGYSVVHRYEICVEETGSIVPWRRYRGYIRTNTGISSIPGADTYARTEDRAAARVETILLWYFRVIGCNDWYWADLDKSDLDVPS